jgi:hypothetical protein
VFQRDSYSLRRIPGFGFPLYHPSVELPRMSKKEIFRVVTRAQDGSLRIRDFHSAENILATHSQVGTDDSSTDLDLRGMPVFRGLIGPIPEGKNIVRYESPEVFETLTKEWASSKTRRRSRGTSGEVQPAAPSEWSKASDRRA